MRVVDLFSGAGGMSLGFQQAGFEVVAGLDNWKPAVDTYAANFDHDVFLQDLSDVLSSVQLVSSFNPDVIVGGPPCQDFSPAGGRVELDRADLTRSFAEIVSGVRPKFFVMENVPRAQSSVAYSRMKDTLRFSGYGLADFVLDASLYGVPQKRKRLFCIGGLGLSDGFNDLSVDSFANRESMTMRDYFGPSLGVDHYYRHPRSYSRRGVFSVDEPSPTVRGVNRSVPPGYISHAGDSTTLRDIRALTTLERAKIQTFPDNFVWRGSKTSVEQLIGNSVPVKLAEFVARYLLLFAG